MTPTPTEGPERRVTVAAFTSKGYGEGSVTSIPVERRVGERRARYDEVSHLMRVGPLTPVLDPRSGTDRRAPREKGSVEQDIGAPGLDTQGGFTAASAGPTPFALRDLRVAAGRGERSYCAQCVGEASQGGEA